MLAVSKRRILVIDDQDAIHEDYRKIMCPNRAQDASLGDIEAEIFGCTATEADEWDIYEIDSAYQGQDALEMVENSLQEGRPYAVAFVDMRMPPGLDGVQTVRRIWELDPEVLVVFCSAYCDYSWEDLVQQLGRTDRFLILKKPFDNVEVRQCAAAMAERWAVSRTDALTGILNRRAFDEHLRREWAHSLRHERPLAFVIVDLDLFKVLNDLEGHCAGDQALKLTSQLLGQDAPAGSALCRFGGDEFCMLIPGSDEASATEWAESVRQRIANSTIQIGDRQVQLTLSCGVASLNAAALREADLVDQADQALRAAKRAGRNRTLRWSEISQSDDHLAYIDDYAAKFEGLTARDLMTRAVESVRQDVTVAEAALQFLEFDLAAAPVVNAAGELVGALSEKDVIEALGSTDGWSSRVQQVMMPRVIHYDPDTPAEQIFRFLCRVHMRQVFITEDSRPVGAITCKTFLTRLCESLGPRELTCTSAE